MKINTYCYRVNIANYNECLTPCPNTAVLFGERVVKIGSGACAECQYQIEDNETKREVLCSFLSPKEQIKELIQKVLE